MLHAIDISEHYSTQSRGKEDIEDINDMFKYFSEVRELAINGDHLKNVKDMPDLDDLLPRMPWLEKLSLFHSDQSQLIRDQGLVISDLIRQGELTRLQLVLISCKKQYSQLEAAVTHLGETLTAFSIHNTEQFIV